MFLPKIYLTSRVFQASLLSAVILFILVSLFHLAGPYSSDLGHKIVQILPGSEAADVKTHPQHKDGNATLFEMAPPFVRAIMTPDDTTFSRLECPTPNEERYKYLRTPSRNSMRGETVPKYFFALNLRQCANLLPRLIGSIVETMRFLGPTHCVLSIVEGNSNDGTFEILSSLKKEIDHIGAQYFFESSELKPGDGIDRIAGLAQLRNEALKPMVEHPESFSPDTTVVFLNDVAVCMEDILELIHQRVKQNADMTCALDWTYVGEHPTFYDVWIARAMNGDTFFNIPEDGSWDFAWNLFWNSPIAQQRWRASKPFQVFSCWNGATAFTAKPILEQKVKFRNAKEKECYQGEPKLFCKDMWKAGYGKIAVVPSVNIEYSDAQAKKIKALKGYVSKLVEGDEASEPPLLIEWEDAPPPKVKCMTNYATQTWVDWDEHM